ncbi:MAG: AtpZ/AtpI family protein [Selenomonadaceae bacterium]|nr:AtpZ/AtpI family protein [Selenomonadaceae bacterium]
MNKKEGFLQAVKAFSVLGGLGIYLAVTVGLVIYLGHLFDEHFNTHPYGIFAGIILGFPIAVYGLYRRLKEYL